MYKLEYETHFDAAHHLLNYKGECANVHGHTWKVKVIIESPDLKDDMIIDFIELKQIINKLDHKDINKVIKENPTCENISEWLYFEIKERLRELLDIFTLEIKVWESPNSSITYNEKMVG